MNNTESVIRQATNVWKDVYHLRQPSTEAIEIKDDDNSDDEPDNIGELHALTEQEEVKEEEALESDKDEDINIGNCIPSSHSTRHCYISEVSFHR